MKALVLGSGGREHALAWALRRELGDGQVWLHPGNAGTARQGYGQLPDVALEDRDGLARAAQACAIDCVVIGPETLLAEGYADFLREKGFAVVGPGKSGARLESSKVFAKELMQRAEIPTAGFFVVTERAELLARVTDFPIVLKLDGLAAGKGVVVAQTRADVTAFAERIWAAQEFGPGPHTVLVEAFLSGRELSYIGATDGETFVPFPSATDYKRIGDDDTGPNTGGMGAISPSPYFNADLEAKIQNRIITRLLKRLAIENIAYRGVLYVGLMVNAEGDPFVLEFNARFGDPETQAIVLRAEGGFARLLTDTARATLKTCPPPRWRDQVSLYVVGSAAGYPGKPRTGDIITGLESLPPGIEVFYSGVAEKNGRLVTAGGRVLGLGTLAESARLARENVYAALEQVHWLGRHSRSDIGLPRG